MLCAVYCIWYIVCIYPSIASELEMMLLITHYQFRQLWLWDGCKPGRCDTPKLNCRRSCTSTFRRRHVQEFMGWRNFPVKGQNKKASASGDCSFLGCLDFTVLHSASQWVHSLTLLPNTYLCLTFKMAGMAGQCRVERQECDTIDLPPESAWNSQGRLSKCVSCGSLD